MTLKVSFPWFMDGKEVELPDMKVEGSLAVAELTKKHAEEFLPFVSTLQEEATLRLRVNALSTVLFSDSVTDEQHEDAKAVLKIYDITPAEAKKELTKQYNDLFSKLKDDLIDYATKTARVTIETTPFFMKRSLLEAFYMFKAYVWAQARKDGAKPKMPFTQEDLESLIEDGELAIFTKYTMGKVRKSATADVNVEVETEEDLKKKSSTTPET